MTVKNVVRKKDVRIVVRVPIPKKPVPVHQQKRTLKEVINHVNAESNEIQKTSPRES
jgi:hypothetical protein